MSQLSSVALLSLLAVTGFGSDAVVTVFVDFERPPAKTAVEGMEHEVAKLMRPSGLKINWHPLIENRGTESFESLVVIRFRGTCKVEPDGWDAARPAEPNPVLGFAEVQDDTVSPFGEVLCDEVRRSLVSIDGEINYVRRQGEYGRALGRVVAHELYHILARTTEHDCAGVAKSPHTPEDLRRVYFGFADAAVNELRKFRSALLLSATTPQPK
jgi:hypothetical protein